MEQNNTTDKSYIVTQNAWDKLPLSQKAEMIKVAVKNGIYNLADIKQKYEDLIAEQSDPGMTGMMKSILATSAHYGNPTARRMTDYDGRSYTFPNKWDEVEPGIYEPEQGNVYVSSYGNLVTPQIQDNGKSLEFVEDVWSPENDPRSYAQSLKFNNAKDAQYFGEHYKEIAPMMKLYAKGGKKKTTASGKQAFLSTLDQSLQEDGRFNTPEWRRYFTELANVESGYSPNITNSIGAKGYFQLMPSNRSKNWTTPTQQFHEFYKLAGNNLDYLNKHLTKKDWERAKALGIDIFGLMAGAHLGGVGGVVRALRGQGNAKDSNGTSVMNYMTRFSQSGKGSPYLGSNFSSVPVVRDVSPMSTFTPEQYNLIYGDSFADNSQLFPFETPTITPYVAPDYTNLFNGISTPTIDKSVAEAYSKEQLAKEERANRLNALNLVLGNGLFGNPSDSSSNGLFDFALGDVASNPLMLVSSIYSDNNTFAGGGDMFSLDTLPGFKDFKINKDLYNTELLQYLRFKEGFLDHPKNIGDGVITIGAGLTDPKYIKQYHSLGDTWTEEANKAGMVEEIAARKARLANTLPNWQKLPPASQDALTAYDYNVGISKSNHPSLWDAAAAQNWYEVANQMNATSKNPKFIKGLKQRRAEEQAWFKRGLEERNKKIAVPSSTNILSQALNYYNNAGKNLLKSAYKAARRSLGLGKFKFFDEGGPTEEDDINLFRRNGNYFYQASPDSEEIPLTILDTSLSPDNPVYWTYTDKEGRRYTPKSLPSKEKTITKKWNPYSWGSIVPFEYSRNSYYRPEDALEAFNTITFGGANNFSPVQWGRRIFDIKDVLNGSMSGQQYWDRWINGNEGTGSEAANLLVDGLVYGGKSLYKGTSNFLKNAAANKGFSISTPYLGNYLARKGAGRFTAWVPLNRSWKKGLSWMSTGMPTVEEGLPLEYITSKFPGEARKLYDAGINIAKNDGTEGLVVGKYLLSAPKSYSTYEHYYPTRTMLDETGLWTNRNMVSNPNMRGRSVFSLEDFLNETRLHPEEKIRFTGAPRYRLETPSTAFAEGTPAAEWARTPTITAENAASITPEQWDAAYRAAYERGDRAEGQRLWDLWFKHKAPNAVSTTGKEIPQTLYHTGRDNIIAFRTPESSAKISFDEPYRNISWAEKEGYNITPEELAKYNNGETAVVYKPTGVYLSDDLVTSKTYLGKEPDVNTTYPLFVNLENPLISIGKGEQLYSDASSVRQLQKAIDRGNDGVFLKNIKDYGPNDTERVVDGVWQDSPSTSVVVFDPRRIKSAEPFTLADDGSLIPLTERADFSTPDIRYDKAGIQLLGEEANKTFPALSDAQLRQAIKEGKTDLINLYNSEPYRNNFLEEGFTVDDLNGYLSEIQNGLDGIYQYSKVTNAPGLRGLTTTRLDNSGNLRHDIGLNVEAFSNQSRAIDSAIHESEHAAMHNFDYTQKNTVNPITKKTLEETYPYTVKVMEHNKSLIPEIPEELAASKDPEIVDFIRDNTTIAELDTRIKTTQATALKKGMTIDEMLDKVPEKELPVNTQELIQIYGRKNPALRNMLKRWLVFTGGVYLGLDSAN